MRGLCVGADLIILIFGLLQKHGGYCTTFFRKYNSVEVDEIRMPLRSNFAVVECENREHGKSGHRMVVIKAEFENVFFLICV